MARRRRMVHGNTHSQSATEAESRGELPITRAVEEVYASLECQKHGVSRTTVREFLKENCKRGWHHVAGPDGVREVTYYTTSLTRAQKRKLLGSCGK